MSMSLGPRTWIVLISFSSLNFLGSILCDGKLDERQSNQTRRIRKSYYYVPTQPDLLLPDVRVTFPAFVSQLSATKQMDLTSNSIIRYMPIYEKQPVPTDSSHHFERILNKIKNFKRKLKTHRRKFYTTPQYSSVPVEPLAITPIAVPAYDYFPVGPEYLHQYLQISHKYDRVSCIYLKISEDSFMKVQCYPILPHTDQVENYPNSYNNEILTNPDVANVYQTLVPNPVSYPHNYFYDLQLSATTLGPFGTVPYSYHKGTFDQRPTYPAQYTNVRYHTAPLTHTSPSSGSSITKHPKPNKVLNSNKTSLPLPVSFPSGNVLHGNITDKELTTLSNSYEPDNGDIGFPVHNKNELTDSNSPTKISLLNHAIAPLDIEPTDSSKFFFRPDDTVVVETSTKKFSTSNTTAEHASFPVELNTLPGLSFTNSYDSSQYSEVLSHNVKENISEYDKFITTVSTVGNGNTLSTITATEISSEYDKSVVESIFNENKLSPSTATENISEYDKSVVEISVSVINNKEVGSENTSEYNKSVAETTFYASESTTGISSSDLTTQTSGSSSGLDRTLSSEDRNYEPVVDTEHANRIHTLDTHDTTIAELPHEILHTHDFDLSTPFIDRNEKTEEYITTELSMRNIVTEEFREITTNSTYDSNLLGTNNSSTGDNLRQFHSTTIHENILSSSVDLTQLLTNINDAFETTTHDLNELLTYTLTEVESVNLKQLTTTSADGFVLSTTEDSPNDFRNLPTTTTNEFVFSTTEDLPDDLRRSPTTTTEKFVVSTSEDSADDLRKLPTTTTDEFILSTSENSANDLEKLTTNEFVISTTEDSPDDLRNLATSTTEGFVISTTSDLSDDLRKLPTTITNEFVLFTTEDSAGDLRILSTPQYTVTNNTESTAHNEGQFSTTAANIFLDSTIGNLLYDLRQVSNVESPTANTLESSSSEVVPLTSTTGNVHDSTENLFKTNTRHFSIAVEVSSESDLKKFDVATKDYTGGDLKPTSSDNDDLPFSTTDGSMTWFTSDLDDSISKPTLPTNSLVRIVNKNDISTPKADIIAEIKGVIKSYTTPQNLKGAIEQSTEDNEIIPQPFFTKNSEVKINVNGEKMNPSVNNTSNTGIENKIILDKHNILSLSAEDIKQDFGRKIPLETNEGNVVKVLEKNSNTGNWEVQFYKVNENNTSLNSEDIDLPRRSDVLISDYDGYDNIDSDAEVQYEYDYHVKNNSAIENVGKISEMLNFKSLLDNKLNNNNVGPAKRNRRHDSYNVKELDQLNSSYEKMKENNSTVLSDIKEITQNNTQNSNSTNLNVNYLDDFLKLTDKVRKYYDEKKEIKRTKRTVVNDTTTLKGEFLKLMNEYDKYLEKYYHPGRIIIKRQISPFILYSVNVTRPQRTKRYKRDVAITNTIDNSVDIDANITTEKIKNNTTVKHLLFSELLEIGNTTPPASGLKLEDEQENNDDTKNVNIPYLSTDKNSKFLNIRTTPNYATVRQNSKSNVKSFNSSPFNIQYITETTTVQKEHVFTFIPKNSSNETYIFKHENASHGNQNYMYASVGPVAPTSISSLLDKQINVSFDTTVSSNVDLINKIQTQSNKTKNVTPGMRQKYVNFFQNLKYALKNVSTEAKNTSLPKSSEAAEYNSSSNNSNSNTPYVKLAYDTNFINIRSSGNTNNSVNTNRFKDSLQHTINFIKNITTLLRKQNTSSVRNANDVNDMTGKVNKPIQTPSKTYELKFTIGKMVNATSTGVMYVPMYVEILLVTQIVLLLVLVTFFIFLHYADSRLNKRHQFDTSVTFLNNAFEPDRIFNDLP